MTRMQQEQMLALLLPWLARPIGTIQERHRVQALLARLIPRKQRR